MELLLSYMMNPFVKKNRCREGSGKEDFNMGKKQTGFSTVWRWGKPYHGQYIMSIVLATVGVACGMVPYFCAAGIVTKLLSDTQVFSDYLLLLFIALLGYLGKILFSSCATLVSHNATYLTLRDIRKMMIEKLSRVPMGTILNTPSGQYKTTIVDRVEGMEPTLAHLLPEMTSNLLIPFAIFIYLLILDWRMALASIVTFIFGMIVISFGMKSYPEKWAGAVRAGKDMEGVVIEYIGGIKVAKAFSQSAGSYKKYADAVAYNSDYYIGWMRENQKITCVCMALLPSTLASVLPVGFILWACGTLSVAKFLTVIILSLGIMGPMMAASSFTDELAALDTNVSEIQKILNEPELHRPEKEVTLKGSSIVLRDVSFAYEKNGEKALHHVNLTIQPGTVTALVGPSGSGKSTIAKLIAGFWDVSEGTIYLGGIDTCQIPLQELSSQISYVSQDNYLFNQSIRENICMGRKGASDQEIEAVAKAACCDELISKLENGYETMAGAGGGHLSGGEKQRISIARALLKDAPIIILDEASASIDPENEVLIQKAISSLTAGKTLIVIAHRLSTIVEADNIAVVQHGRIIAQGTHEQLLQCCQLYQKLWDAHNSTEERREQNVKNL